MAIKILEVKRRARHPVVVHWASGRHAAFAKNGGRLFEIRLANGEGEMVARELSAALLKHDHPGGTPGAKEQPFSPIVPKADRETQYISVERLGSRELAHRNRDLVETSN